MQPRISAKDQCSGDGIRLKKLNDSRMQILVGSAQLELRAVSSRTDLLDNRRFHMLQFRIADRDKNSYLAADEFSALGLPEATFESVDADGNSEVTRDELVRYIDRDAIAAQSHPFVAMTQEGTSLFDVVDVDYDNRLTLRELRRFADQAKAFDRDQNGQIDVSEMRRKYVLQFSLGKPRVFSSPMGMASSNGLPLPRANQARSGPEWFRRMDRNQDGDLDWSEFLGEEPLFMKVDQDHDGLIDPIEAEQFNSDSRD
jgi:Ca2+-binding EF-hand superfamily protein